MQDLSRSAAATRRARGRTIVELRPRGLEGAAKNPFLESLEKLTFDGFRSTDKDAYVGVPSAESNPLFEVVEWVARRLRVELIGLENLPAGRRARNNRQLARMAHHG